MFTPDNNMIGCGGPLTLAVAISQIKERRRSPRTGATVLIPPCTPIQRTTPSGDLSNSDANIYAPKYLLNEFKNGHKTVRVYRGMVVKLYKGDADVASCATHEHRMAVLFANHPHIMNARGDIVFNQPRNLTVLRFTNHGFELNDAINRGMTVAQKVLVVSQIASAVQFMHSKGYVHRDIKMDNVCVSRTTTAATSGGARLNHVVATLVDLETCMVADEINPHHAVGTRAYFHPKMMTNAAQKRAPYADLSVYEVDVWAFAVMVLVMFREQHAWSVPHASNRNYQKFQSYVFDTPSAWVEDLRIVQSAGLNRNVVAENMVYTALRVLRTYHQSPPTALESREGHDNSPASIMEAFTWRP